MSHTEIKTIGLLAADTYDFLVRNGWCQRLNVTSEGKVCLQGAVNAAAYGSPDPWGQQSGPGDDIEFNYTNPAIAALEEGFKIAGLLEEYRSQRRGVQTESLWSWNDRPGRTVEEVRKALDTVILATLHAPCDLTLSPEAEAALL